MHMVWYFSIKTAYLLLAISLIAGWVITPSKRLVAILEFISLGSGRMLERNYSSAIPLALLTPIMVLFMHLMSRSFDFGDTGSFLLEAFMFLFFIYFTVKLIIMTSQFNEASPAPSSAGVLHPEDQHEQYLKERDRLKKMSLFEVMAERDSKKRPPEYFEEYYNQLLEQKKQLSGKSVEQILAEKPTGKYMAGAAALGTLYLDDDELADFFEDMEEAELDEILEREAEAEREQYELDQKLVEQEDEDFLFDMLDQMHQQQFEEQSLRDMEELDRFMNDDLQDDYWHNDDLTMDDHHHDDWHSDTHMVNDLNNPW